MTAPTTSRTPATTGRLRRRLAVLAVTVLTGLATWAVLDLLLGVELRAHTGSTVSTVGPGSVAFAALVIAGAGWALLAVLERRTALARRVWTVVAVVTLVLSLLGALGGASAAAIAGLMALHVVVGLTVIIGMRTAT